LLTSDITKIKLKAASMWIPYQTLMTIKMHEFANS
jgi:predicted DNA binding CopG/RHH family protein